MSTLEIVALTYGLILYIALGWAIGVLSDSIIGLLLIIPFYPFFFVNPFLSAIIIISAIREGEGLEGLPLWVNLLLCVPAVVILFISIWAIS